MRNRGLELACTLTMLGACAGETTTQEGHDFPKLPTVEMAAQPESNCSFYEDWRRPDRGTFKPDVLPSEIGEIFVDVDSFDDSEAPFIGDPNYEALEAEFRAEAAKQAARVKKAGGYCNLPVLADMEDDAFYRWSEVDARLGSRLDSIAAIRDSFVATQYPEWPGHVHWSVELGRSICAYEDTMSDGSLERDGRLKDKDPEKLQAALKKVNALILRWNDMCAEAQGGKFSGELHDNPYAGAQLLVERGRIIASLMTEEELRTAIHEWQKYYMDDKVDLTGDLTDLEMEQFLGSAYLSNEWLGYDNNGSWECSTDAGIGDAGAVRSRGSGIVYDCEIIPGLERNEWGGVRGVRKPFSVFPE